MRKKLKNKKENAFEIERIRDFLSVKDNKKKFLSTYLTENWSIKDLNSSAFWNKIFLTNGPEEIKSPIVKDKITSIIKIIRNIKGNLLDVGFGCLFVEKELIKKKINNFLFYGIDISDIAITKARKELNGKFLKGSILKIPFKDNFFNVILCLEVLEHIKPNLIFKSITELNRVLKDDGLLILSIPINENLEQKYNNGINPSGHLREYTENIISLELELCGFKIFSKKYFYAFNNLYKFKIILKNIFQKRWKPNNLLIVARKK